MSWFKENPATFDPLLAFSSAEAMRACRLATLALPGYGGGIVECIASFLPELEWESIRHSDPLVEFLTATAPTIFDDGASDIIDSIPAADDKVAGLVRKGVAVFCASERTLAKSEILAEDACRRAENIDFAKPGKHAQDPYVRTMPRRNSCQGRDELEDGAIGFEQWCILPSDARLNTFEQDPMMAQVSVCVLYSCAASLLI